MQQSQQRAILPLHQLVSPLGMSEMKCMQHLLLFDLDSVLHDIDMLLAEMRAIVHEEIAPLRADMKHFAIGSIYKAI